MTVTQERTQTHDLANGLPCSNQLSYQVTRQLSGWIRVLKAELPGIQPKRIPSWHVQWERLASAKRKAQAQILDMLQTWKSDLSLSQSQWERNNEKTKRGKKTVTQGGTWTRDLANGLLWSNHWTTESLGNSVAEFEYLIRLSCQGSSRISLSVWIATITISRSLLVLRKIIMHLSYVDCLTHIYCNEARQYLHFTRFGKLFQYFY